MSEKNIYDKLVDVRSMIGVIKKSVENTFTGSKYADLNTVMDSLAPAMVENKLLYIQFPDRVDGVDVLTTEIINIENTNEKIVSHTHLTTDKQNMQQLGGAITYARRYALVSMFGLESIDDDGALASGKAKSMTATQKHNARMVEAKEKLKKAYDDGDYDTASDMFDYAEENGYMQICDYYHQLFDKDEPVEKDGM